jgi:hypothetical protein
LYCTIESFWPAMVLSRNVESSGESCASVSLRNRKRRIVLVRLSTRQDA